MAKKAKSLKHSLTRRSIKRRPLKKYPSFVGLKPSSSISSRSKQANRSKGTKHELLLMRELRRLGLKFKRNVKELPGKPDIVFPLKHVAVFCDGDFWHGRNWQILNRKLVVGMNGNYWKSKIASNIRRDKKVKKELNSLGWKIIRIWETDIKANPKIIAKTIFRAII